LPTKENKLSFSVFCCRQQTEVCRFRFPYKYNETAASTYIFIYLFIYVIDGQVRLVRLVRLKRGTFVCFFVNKGANDKLPFARIKENCLSFRFPFSVYTVGIRKTEKANFRLFSADGKRKTGVFFPWSADVKGNCCLLFQQTCPKPTYDLNISISISIFIHMCRFKRKTEKGRLGDSL
jgi:hypothetical protein